MLNDDQVQKVRQTLMSSGWNEVMRPILLNKGKFALTALTMSPTERQRDGGEFKDCTDDDLRTAIKAYEWMAICWSNEVNVADYNRRLEELQRQENGAETPA